MGPAVGPAAVTLTGTRVGRDVHVGDTIYNVLSPSESKTEENYDELIVQAESLLYEQDFDSADEVLERIPNDTPQAGYANLLKAVTLLAKRSFNAIGPMERIKIEKHLVLARKKMKNDLIPSILLAILEVDYYNYHGRVSKNDVSPETIRQRLIDEPLCDEHKIILKSLKPSDEAKKRVGLDHY